MVIKRRTNISEQAAELADEVANRIYGVPKEKHETQSEDFVVTSISIPRSMLHKLEDKALTNKRKGIEPKNTSALIRFAVKQLLTNS